MEDIPIQTSCFGFHLENTVAAKSCHGILIDTVGYSVVHGYLSSTIRNRQRRSWKQRTVDHVYRTVVTFN